MTTDFAAKMDEIARDTQIRCSLSSMHEYSVGHIKSAMLAAIELALKMEPTMETASAGAAKMVIVPVPNGEPLANHMLRRAAKVYRAMTAAQLAEIKEGKP